MLKDYLTYILCVNFSILGAIHIFNIFQQFKAWRKYGAIGSCPPEVVAKLKRYTRIVYWAFGIFALSSFILFFIAGTQG